MTLTPIGRAKVLPKLAKIGIPMTILDRLTSTQLTEVLCMFIIILYHTKVQEMGIPHYITSCYRRADLTAAMAMEKIRYIFPALHFNILRNMDFFKEDRLGICKSFYEVPVQKARGDCPSSIVARARLVYHGYSSHQADLREKIRQSGTKDSADNTVQRLLSPPQDNLLMDIDSGAQVNDLRNRITGIPAPDKLEFFT